MRNLYPFIALLLFIIFSIEVIGAEVTEVDDGLFVSQMEGLTFVLEKIDGKIAFDKWKSYFKQNLTAWDNADKVESLENVYEEATKTKWGRVIPTDEGNAMQGVTNGGLQAVISAGDSLYKKRNGDYWIAYAKENDRIGRLQNDEFDSVILHMVVVSDSSAPLQVHEDIVRNITNYLEKEPTHKNLSMKLNGFAAKAIEKFGLRNKYMIFTPKSTMFSIIKRAMPNDIYIGENSTRLKMVGSFTTDYESNPTKGPIATPNFKIQVFNDKGIAIFESDAEKVRNDHYWLFNLLSVGAFTTLTLVDLEALKKQFD